MRLPPLADEGLGIRMALSTLLSTTEEDAQTVPGSGLAPPQLEKNHVVPTAWHANSVLFQCRYSTSQDAFLTPNAMTHPGRLGSPHPRGSQLNLRENHKRSELKLPVSLTN